MPVAGQTFAYNVPQTDFVLVGTVEPVKRTTRAKLALPQRSDNLYPANIHDRIEPEGINLVLVGEIAPDSRKVIATKPLCLAEKPLMLPPCLIYAAAESESVQKD